MGKRLNKAEHEMKRESRKFQRGETADQKKELAENLLLDATKQFARITVSVLREELGSTCDILMPKTGDFHGNHMYYINKKGSVWKGEGTIMKGEGPILLTVTKDCKFNIRLNPSKKEDLESFYYSAEGLDTKDLVKEMDTFKSFLSDETVPAGSKFKRENLRYNDEDVNDILAGYDTDPEGSKPK